MEYDWWKHPIEAARSLDERSKRKVIIVTTIIIMVAIVFIWLKYFNSLFPSH